jgi:hypothetical protein
MDSNLILAFGPDCDGGVGCRRTGQADCLLMIGRLFVIWLTLLMEERE